MWKDCADCGDKYIENDRPNLPLPSAMLSISRVWARCFGFSDHSFNVLIHFLRNNNHKVMLCQCWACSRLAQKCINTALKMFVNGSNSKPASAKSPQYIRNVQKKQYNIQYSALPLQYSDGFVSSAQALSKFIYTLWKLVNIAQVWVWSNWTQTCTILSLACFLTFHIWWIIL